LQKTTRVILITLLFGQGIVVQLPAQTSATTGTNNTTVPDPHLLELHLQGLHPQELSRRVPHLQGPQRPLSRVCREGLLAGPLA